MADGKTYDIPAAGFDWFKTKLETLAKRAKRLTGEKMFFTVVGFHKEENTDSKFFGQRINEVFVAFPEPKLEGWEFVARIDHSSEAGNIVRTTGMRDLPIEYRNSDPVCDHCGHKRRRRDTFVVYNEEENRFCQVGSTCLKDFLGHGDADKWAKIAELMASISEFASGSRNSSFSGDLVDHRWISTQHFMELCAESILNKGFTSKKVAWETNRESTASAVWTSMDSTLHLPSEAAVNLAAAARDWAQNLSGDLSDYEHNCYVIANSEGIEPRSIGIAASIVGVFYKKNSPTRGVSDFVGVKGSKIETLVRVLDVRTLQNSYLCKMRDDNDNLFTWFASRDVLRKYVGKTIRIRGTVKDFSTFNNVKSTVINRVSVI